MTANAEALKVEQNSGSRDPTMRAIHGRYKALAAYRPWMCQRHLPQFLQKAWAEYGATFTDRDTSGACERFCVDLQSIIGE